MMLERQTLKRATGNLSRALFVFVLACLMVACPQKAPVNDKLMPEAEAIRDLACSCKDLKCATEVKQRQVNWTKSAKGATVPPGHGKQAKAALKEAATCIRKLQADLEAADAKKKAKAGKDAKKQAPPKQPAGGDKGTKPAAAPAKSAPATANTPPAAKDAPKPPAAKEAPKPPAAKDAPKPSAAKKEEAPGK